MNSKKSQFAFGKFSFGFFVSLLVFSVAFIVCPIIYSDTISSDATEALFLSEVMPNPFGSESSLEWFELYNHSASALDISGMVISDSVTSVNNFTVPLSTIIPSNGYALFARNWTDLQANYPEWFSALSNYTVVDHVTLLLNNSGDSLTLKKSDGTIVDVVAYNNTITGWTLNPSEGNTLCRQTLLHHSDPLEWSECSSGATGTNKGTPGSGNFSQVIETPPSDSSEIPPTGNGGENPPAEDSGGQTTSTTSPDTPTTPSIEETLKDTTTPSTPVTPTVPTLPSNTNTQMEHAVSFASPSVSSHAGAGNKKRFSLKLMYFELGLTVNTNKYCLGMMNGISCDRVMDAAHVLASLQSGKFETIHHIAYILDTHTVKEF